MACTLGGLGIWYLYDCILVGAGQFRDADGRLVRRWDPEVPESGERIGAEVLEELEALRHEVAELAERVDFAERLLAKPERSNRESSTSHADHCRLTADSADSRC